MAQRKRSVSFSPKQGSLVECRGATWRFLGTDHGFWHLELVKEGPQFAENPVRVWALPELESDTLRLLDDAHALAPVPEDSQREKGRFYKPLIQARVNHSIQDGGESLLPKTALHCAIQHKEWQFQPWKQLSSDLPFPRILIADDVGLGKTTEAAIILAELTRRRRAERVLVVAPQHLCEKWQDELYERFGLAFEIYDRDTRVRLHDQGVKNPWEIVERVIVSRDFVKRWENLKALECVTWDVIVIDECHHFVRDKNEAPSRVRELAEKIVYTSPGLILLSATPFTGSKAEFQSLLKLLDPKFHNAADAERWDPCNPYLIRRLKDSVKKHGEIIQDRVIQKVEVKEKDLSPPEKKVLDQVRTVIEEHRFAPDAAPWDRLLEETVRKRLSSGWRAFRDTISGNQRLATWFPEDLKKQVSDLVIRFESAKLRALQKLLQGIAKNDPKAKVVVFTEAIPTQDEIYEFLTQKGGYGDDAVAKIHGSTPRDERFDIEDRFANPASNLRILVATDTIAEGKDLQHACHHLVHFELPWSLVKIEQRNGRIDRLGQNETPYIHNLIFDTAATPDQKILDRLGEKLERARSALGSVSPIIASFDALSMDALGSEGAAQELEFQIDKASEEANQFGLGSGSVTALSGGPLVDHEDFDLRRLNLSVMLEALGGKLEPYGKVEHQFLLTLPAGWELPGLEALGEGYPDGDNPWRVTFHPKIYLDYEAYRRQHGEGKEPLRFLSPVHPVITQIESRFRAQLAQKGYPVFMVQGSAHAEMILVEFSARSPSSRIMAQKLVALELKSFREVDIDVLSRDLAGADGKGTLPAGAQWAKVQEMLQERATAFAKSLAQQYEARATTYRREQEQLPKDLPGRTAREQWIKDLWTVDVTQAHFQILALLIAKR
jgi:superfamily II DNA or RNA helicase